MKYVVKKGQKTLKKLELGNTKKLENKRKALTKNKICVNLNINVRENRNKIFFGIKERFSNAKWWNM